MPSKNGCTGHPLPNEHEITLKSSFLVGCDGANSTVRKLADISSTDLNFENDWLIADLVSEERGRMFGLVDRMERMLMTFFLIPSPRHQLIKDGYVPEKVKKVGCAQICDPARPTTCVFGGKGRKRFEFMRLPNETQEEILAEETLWRCLEPWGYKKVREPFSWFALRVSATSADAYWYESRIRTTASWSAKSCTLLRLDGPTSSTKVGSCWLETRCTSCRPSLARGLTPGSEMGPLLLGACH